MNKTTRKLLGINLIFQLLDWLSTYTALKMPGTKAKEANPIARWFTDNDKWGTLLGIKVAVVVFSALRARKLKESEIEKFNSGMKKANWLYAFVLINNSIAIFRNLRNKKGAN